MAAVSFCRAVCRSWLGAAVLIASLGAVSGILAQERRERPGPTDPPAQEPRERDDAPEGFPEQDAPRRAPLDRADRQGTPEGMPQARIAPPGGEGRYRLFPRRWVLGVHAYNTDAGVVVTRVLPGSPAARIGLEPRDRIVTVDGFQVGMVDGRLYLLGDELQHRAGPRGRVRLLVQNWRDNELLNLDAALRRDADFYEASPRDRE